jgi:hypothetical protein
VTLSVANIPDEALIEIIKGDRTVTTVELEELADELLKKRRILRRDSRRAEELRRLRWSCELLIQKVEKIPERIEEREDDADGADS